MILPFLFTTDFYECATELRLVLFLECPKEEKSFTFSMLKPWTFFPRDCLLISGPDLKQVKL